MQANTHLEQFLEHLRYEAVLKGAELKGLMRVHLAQAGPEQLVAGYLTFGQGIIIFVPPPSSANMSTCDAYAVLLAHLPEVLKSGDTARLGGPFADG
jgi:hypothetical protein